MAPAAHPQLPGLLTAPADPPPAANPSPMARVIARVLQMLFHAADRPDHVLAFGYGRRKDSSAGVRA